MGPHPPCRCLGGGLRAAVDPTVQPRTVRADGVVDDDAGPRASHGHLCRHRTGQPERPTARQHKCQLARLQFLPL
jgi:hypothetical protein